MFYTKPYECVWIFDVSYENSGQRAAARREKMRVLKVKIYRIRPRILIINLLVFRKKWRRLPALIRHPVKLINIEWRFILHHIVVCTGRKPTKRLTVRILRKLYIFLKKYLDDIFSLIDNLRNLHMLQGAWDLWATSIPRMCNFGQIQEWNLKITIRKRCLVSDSVQLYK